MVIEDYQKPSRHKNQVNYAYAFLSGALFILATELCIGVYLYKYVGSEVKNIREDCILKQDFDAYFWNRIETYIVKNELVDNLKGSINTSQTRRVERSPVSKYSCREYCFQFN